MPNFDEKGNAYNQEGKHERTRVMQADAVHGTYVHETIVFLLRLRLVPTVYQNINTTALIKAFPEAEAEMARRDVRYVFHEYSVLLTYSISSNKSGVMQDTKYALHVVSFKRQSSTTQL